MSLPEFFSATRALLRGEQSPDAFAHALGEASVPARLDWYRDLVAGHLDEILDKLYPRTAALLGSQWTATKARYEREHPPRSWELNACAAELPSLLEDTLLAELADFEWSDFALYSSVACPESAAGVNPTTLAREYRHRIVSWVLQPREQRAERPVAGAELALGFRPPNADVAHWLVPDELTLQVLAAVANGVRVEELTASARERAVKLQRHGLLL